MNNDDILPPHSTSDIALLPRHQHHRYKRRDGALHWHAKPLLLPAIVVTALSVVLITLLLVLSSLRTHAHPERGPDLVQLQAFSLTIMVWSCLLGWTPVLVHKYYSYPNADATTMGYQFFASVTGFLLGIWGAVAESRLTSLWSTDPALWGLGLYAVLVAFLAPIAAVVVLFRRAMAATQNKALEEGWVVSFLRCTWIRNSTKQIGCIIVPLLAMTLFVVVLALESYDVQPTPHAYRLDLFVVGTCGLCGWWTVSSAVIFCRTTRNRCTTWIIVFNSVLAVGWACAGVVLLVKAVEEGENNQVPHLYGAAVAGVVLLFVAGGCSGCCVGVCHVEKFFDDGAAVRMMDTGVLKEEEVEGGVDEDVGFEEGLERGWFGGGGGGGGGGVGASKEGGDAVVF